jgi:hypothetical protein
LYQCIVVTVTGKHITGEHDGLEVTLRKAGLGPQEARAYILREIEGVGRSETADRLEKSTNTIDSQVQSAKKKLDAMEAAVADPRTCDDALTPVAELGIEMGRLVLYPDGETMIADEGGCFCSEHGAVDDYHEMNLARCNHGPVPDHGTVPIFDAGKLLPLRETHEMQEAVLEHVAEHYPERLAEIAAPLFEDEQHNQPTK